MAGSTRAVWENYSSGREEFGKNKSVKRVSFLEDDMVVIIPSNEDLENTKTFTTIPRCRIPGRLYSSSFHTATGLARVGPNGSLKSQTAQRRFLRAGDHSSLRSKEKQVKSILKKSSTQSCLQNSRFYDSYRGDYGIPIDSPSIKYKVGVDQQEKSKLNFNYSYVKNKEGFEGSDSYSDFLKRQRRGNTESPQPSTGYSFYKTSFSPHRTLVQRHGNFNVARPLKSTSPEEQHRKPEMSKQTSSIIRNSKSDVLDVVGNMLNVSDLYPVLSNLQKKSPPSSDSSLSKHQGVGGRYIPARELISRNGPGSNARISRNATQNPAAALRPSNNLTQSNVSTRASAGLGRAAELSLLNRLRKFERNDPPYLAWQAERSIHASPTMTAIPTRASSLTSVYGGSLGSRISTVLEKPSSALRSPGSSQYYY